MKAQNPLGPQQDLPYILKSLNQKKYPHNQYLGEICKLFNLSLKPITNDFKTFLGGFIVGEGSINVSLKRNGAGAYGMYLDLEFNVSQEENNIIYLVALLSLFHTGRIKFKGGRRATYVYVVEARESLREKIIPFWDKYIEKRLSIGYKERYFFFKKLLVLFKEKKHLDPDIFITQFLPLWDSMRKQRGQKSESFKCLEDAIIYAKGFIEKKGCKKSI